MKKFSAVNQQISYIRVRGTFLSLYNSVFYVIESTTSRILSYIHIPEVVLII